MMGDGQAQGPHIWPSFTSADSLLTGKFKCSFFSERSLHLSIGISKLLLWNWPFPSVTSVYPLGGLGRLILSQGPWCVSGRADPACGLGCALWVSVRGGISRIRHQPLVLDQTVLLGYAWRASLEMFSASLSGTGRATEAGRPEPEGDLRGPGPVSAL